MRARDVGTAVGAGPDIMHCHAATDVGTAVGAGPDIMPFHAATHACGKGGHAREQLMRGKQACVNIVDAIVCPVFTKGHAA